MTDKMMAEESFPSSQGKRNLRSRMSSSDTMVLTSSKGRRNSTRLQKAVTHIEETDVRSFSPEITSDTANLPRTPLRRTTRRTSILDENQDSNFSPAKTPLRNTRVTSIADENSQSKTPVRRSRRLSTDTHDAENMLRKAGKPRLRPISPKEEIVLEEREEPHEGSNNDSRKDVKKISVSANKYEKLLNRFENPKTPLGDQVNDLSNDSTSEIKDQKEKKGEQPEENINDTRAVIKKSVVNIQRFETLLNRPENTKASLGHQASDDSTETKSETKVEGETSRNSADELSQNDGINSEESKTIEEEPEAALVENAEDRPHEKAKPDGQVETDKFDVNKSSKSEENEIADTTQKMEDEGLKDNSVNKDKDDPLQGISLVAFAPSMHSSHKKSPIRFPKTPGVWKNVPTPEGEDNQKKKNSSSGKKAKNTSTSHHENEVSLSCKKSINFDSSQDEDDILASTLEVEKSLEEANKSSLKSGNTSQDELGLKRANEKGSPNKSSKKKPKRTSRHKNESVPEVIHIDLDHDDYDGVRPHRRKAKKVTSYCENDFEIEPMVDLTATGEVVDLTDDYVVDLTGDAQQNKEDEKTDIVICDDSEEVHSQDDADAEMNFIAMVPEVVIEEIAVDTTGKVEVSQKTLKSLVDGSSIFISNGLEIVKMPTQNVMNQTQKADESEKSQVESIEIDEDETDEANASKAQTLNKQPDYSEQGGALENDSAGSNPKPVDPVTVYECQVKVSDNSRKTVCSEEDSVAGGDDGMEKNQEKKCDQERQEGESKALQNALETSESFKDCVEEDSSGVFESVDSPGKTNNDDQTLEEVSENLEADNEGTSHIMAGDTTVVADKLDEVCQLNVPTPVPCNEPLRPHEGDKEINKDVEKCAMDESNIGDESRASNSILIGESSGQSPQKLGEAQKKSSMDDEKDFENLEESIKPSEPTKNDSKQGENGETPEKNLDARNKELVRILVEDVESQNTSRETAQNPKLDSSISSIAEPVADKSMSIVEDSVMLSDPLQDDTANVSMSIVEGITDKLHPPKDEMTNVSMSVDGDNTDSEGSAIMEVTSKNLESHQPSIDEKSTDMSLQIAAGKDSLNKTQCLAESKTEKSAPLTEDMMNVSATRDGENTDSEGSATTEVASKKLETHQPSNQPLDMEVEKDSLATAVSSVTDKNSETEGSENMEITSKNLEAQEDGRDLDPANGERCLDETPSEQEKLLENESDANQPTSANINATSVQDTKIDASENEDLQHPVGSQHAASKSQSPEPDTQDERKMSNQSITSNCQELDSDFISVEDHELIEQIEAEARRRQMSQNFLESKDFALEEKSQLSTEISPKDSNREVEGNEESTSQDIKDSAEKQNKLKQNPEAILGISEHADDSPKDTTVKTPQEHEIDQQVERFSQPQSLNSVGVDEVPLSHQVEDIGSEDTDASNCSDQDEDEEGEFDSFIVSDTENDELVIDENTSNYDEMPEKSEKNGDRLEVSSDEEFEHLIVEPSESSNDILMENLALKGTQQQRFCNKLAIPETTEKPEIDISLMDSVEQNKITLVEENPNTTDKSDSSLIDPAPKNNVTVVEENPKEIEIIGTGLIDSEALTNKLPVPEMMENPKENDNSSTPLINSVEQNNVTLVEENPKATNESNTSSSNPVEQNANTIEKNQERTDKSSPSLIDSEALNNQWSVPETTDNTKKTDKSDTSFIDPVEQNIASVVEENSKEIEKPDISLIDSTEQRAISEIEKNPENCKNYNIITVVKEESESHSEKEFIENHDHQSTSKIIKEGGVVSNDECLDIKKEQDDGGIEEDDTENLNDHSVNPGTAETADELPNPLSVDFEAPLDSKLEGLKKCTEENRKHDKTLANNENCNNKEDANQRREESLIEHANGRLNNSEEDDSCNEELLKINWQQNFEYSLSESMSHSIQKSVLNHSDKDVLKSTDTNTKEINSQGKSSKKSPKILCSIDFALVNKRNEENETSNENIINAEANEKTNVMEPENSETGAQKYDSAKERVRRNEKFSENDLAKHSETSTDNTEPNFDITGCEAPKPKRKRQKDNLMDKEDIKKMKLTNDQNANVISVPSSTPTKENTNSTKVNKAKKKNAVQQKTLKDVTAEIRVNAEEMKLDETENCSKQNNESKTSEKLIETEYREEDFGSKTNKKKLKTKSDVYATDEYPITIVDTTIKKIKTDETQNFDEINNTRPHVKKTSAKIGEKKLNTQANVIYDIDEYPITIVDTTIKKIKTDAKEALGKSNNSKYEELNKTRPHVKEASSKTGEKELKTKANVEYESDEYPITVVYKANEKIKAEKTKNSNKINDSKNIQTNLKTASHIEERKKSGKKSTKKSDIVYDVDEYPITLVDTNNSRSDSEESQEEIVLKKSKLTKKQEKKIQNKKPSAYENEFIESSFLGTTSPKLKEYKKTAKLEKKNSIKKRRLNTKEITNVPLHFAATKENSTMSQKKPKVSKIVSSSGVFNEEPVTPKRTEKMFGFIETYKSPMAVGFRINDINQSNNGKEKALALQSVTRRLYTKDDLAPADTEYTTAGEFTVFKLPKPARKLKNKRNISLTRSNVVVKRRQDADIALYIDRAAKVRKVEIL